MDNLNEKPVEANTTANTTPAPPAQTGPRSEAGKAISSKNAMKHGCCAPHTLILAHENLEDYKTIELAWRKAYSPNNEIEYHMVTELINADWFLQRATRTLESIERGMYEFNSDPNTWTKDMEQKLVRHMRYKTAASNLVDKKRKVIEDYRKARQAEKREAEKISIAKERLEVYKKKNRPEQTWKEKLAEMKKQAIALGFNPPEVDPTRR